MLPTLEPMLALPSPPFDSPQYSFEIKWDGGPRPGGSGGQLLAAVGPGLERLHATLPGARGRARLACGHAAGRRSGGACAAGWQTWRLCSSAMPWPIPGGSARRGAGARSFTWSSTCSTTPAAVCCTSRSSSAGSSWPKAALDVPQLVYSAGVVGPGQAFYETVLAAGHEGVVTKRLGSVYRPGRRASAWRKIKPGPRRRPGQRTGTASARAPPAGSTLAYVATSGPRWPATATPPHDSAPRPRFQPELEGRRAGVCRWVSACGPRGLDSLHNNPAGGRPRGVALRARI